MRLIHLKYANYFLEMLRVNSLKKLPKKSYQLECEGCVKSGPPLIIITNELSNN